MCIFGPLANPGVTASQQQGIRVADFRPNQAEITGRIEQARIPPFPVRQKRFDLLAKTHPGNVTEATAADNELGRRLLFEQSKRSHDQRQRKSAEQQDRYLGC